MFPTTNGPGDPSDIDLSWIAWTKLKYEPIRLVNILAAQIRLSRSGFSFPSSFHCCLYLNESPFYVFVTVNEQRHSGGRARHTTRPGTTQRD